MAGLAHDQIYFLRKRLVKLEHRLGQLELQLRPQSQPLEKKK
jgi:hypothetical protein